MKKLALFGLSLAALCIGAVPQLKNANQKLEARDATIIVKMKGDVSNASYDYVIAKQNALLSNISANVTSNYKVLNRYSKIFNGFVMEVPSAYVSSIRYLPGVDKVSYNNIIATQTSNNDGVRYEINIKNSASKSASAQTMEKPDGTKDGSGTFIAILDTGFYIKTDEIGNQEYHHVFAPLEGDDVVITQESLKSKIDAAPEFHGKYDAEHSTYYNTKVPFYYDYGGDKSGAPSEDYDVYAEGQEHGTHVASIAGGNAGDEYEGVAPKAQMALMKVFTTYMSGSSYQSGAYDSAVLTALEDCLVLGVDSINMSLGSNLNDFDDGEIVQETIRSLQNKGTFVNVAAGNEGKGQWNSTANAYWNKNMVESNIISGYANNLGSFTVASSQADSQFYGEALTIDGNNIQFSDQVTNYNSVDGPVTYEPQRYLMDLLKTGNDEFDFVNVPGLGNLDDYNGIDVNGKIAVVKRGDISFKDKVDNAVKKGAIAVLIIDNTTETEFNIRMSFSDKNDYNPAVPVCFILSKDGELFENSPSHKVKLLKNVDLTNPNARTISSYSSDGMRYDLSIKPEITAPGENIKGAILGAVDKYESLSGTSMATPNVAGAVALMIGEHLGDAAYRKTIQSRLMSTAQPMKDGTPNNNYTSVRRQGAGLLNLDGALNSKVYLDGVDNSGNGIGKAKIELRNNDDIKEGKLNLSFLAINEGSATVNYTAKTYVLAPELTTYSEELYPDFAGKKVQTVNEQLVEVFNDTIEIPVGSTKITLPEHKISEANLAKLADFDEGCILEGFVILEANGDLKQLSIPFLGYYGDLDKVSPVEPFDFEKDDNALYNSDILNYFINNSLNGDFSKADYASHIVAGYWSDTSKVSVSNELVYNKNGIKTMSDGNSNRVKSVGVNPYTGEYDANNLFVGNNGSTNTVIIQQYVNRSVRTNTLTLKNKATGDVILTDHMFDNLYGSSKDPVTGETVYPLYKSHFDSNLFDSGYLAHRAYTIIGLYDTDASKKQINFPDGEYEMIFEYELSYGSTYTVKYNLTIESNLPILQKIEKVNEGGKDYYRFFYSDANVSYVSVNEKLYPVKKVGDYLVADVLASEFGENDAILMTAVDTAYGADSFITHASDKNMVTAFNKIFMAGYDFSYTVEGEDTNDQKFAFTFTKNGKSVTTSGDITYRMRVPYGLDADTLNVVSVDSRGKEKAVKFTVMGDLVQFASTAKTFRLTSDFVPGTEKLTGIAVTSNPTKVDYIVDDEFDATGLVVTASYNNNTTKELNANEYQISGADFSTPGEKTITITYEGQTATFVVNVVAPVILTDIVVTAPSKATYEIGEALNLEGLVVTANYSDGTNRVLNADEYQLSDVDLSVAGEKVIMVTFEGKTASFVINVNAPAPVESSVSGDTSSVAPSSSNNDPEPAPSKGCGGSIIACSSTLLLAALGFVMISLKKKEF